MTERILPTGIDTPELVVDRDRLYANVLGLQPSKSMSMSGIWMRSGFRKRSNRRP